MPTIAEILSPKSVSVRMPQIFLLFRRRSFGHLMDGFIGKMIETGNLIVPLTPCEDGSLFWLDEDSAKINGFLIDKFPEGISSISIELDFSQGERSIGFVRPNCLILV